MSTPVSRRAPSSTNPHLYLLDTFGFSHPMLRDPTVHVQTTGDLQHLYNSVPGGKGTPNSFGYTAPNYDGPPANPTAADLQTHAEHTARCVAINMHYRGMHVGSGEFAAGSKSGCLYLKGFGLCQAADDTDPCPIQFRPADAISGTAPALIETNCGTASLTSLVNVPWSRFSPYHAQSVAKASAWAGWFCAELKRLCENFTLHSSGPARLTFPEIYIDDNEDCLRYQHFSLASFVNDANKASFVDYNAGSPNSLLGQSIPGYVYRTNIKNHILNAAGTGDLDRFATEPIWFDCGGPSFVPKTFKDRWQRWIAEGVFTGSTPLPVSMTDAQRFALNAFGQELYHHAFRTAFLNVWEQVFGFRLRATNYQCVKGADDFSEQWLYRHSNFGWDEQVVDWRISQGSASSFDITAGLAEAARRLAFCSRDLPIRATFRVKSIGTATADYGDWSWIKALWKFGVQNGVHCFHWFSYDDQQDALAQAWREFRADIGDDVPAAAARGAARRSRVARR
ncbi:MAG: hypothetical protein JSS51_04380 [Planctomycetes bacterium]|nr:hypothetical protein [Planctomycetota bacterium]